MQDENLEIASKQVFGREAYSELNTDLSDQSKQERLKERLLKIAKEVDRVKILASLKSSEGTNNSLLERLSTLTSKVENLTTQSRPKSSFSSADQILKISSMAPGIV